MSNTKAIVLFSGPGGTTQGIKDAGIEEVVGIEFEETAVETARAAGHYVVHADVRELDPRTVYDELLNCNDDEFFRLLTQMSPPCQGLSMAGKGKGRDDLEFLLNAVQALSHTAGLAETFGQAREMIPMLMETLVADCSDERSPLTFEVMRWIFDLSPDYIMLEQVPAALPIWEAIAEVLESWGYAVWTGNVQAEQYGVPQTRKRAILMATLHRTELAGPVPTHSKYHNRTPDRLDEGVQKWVSMAEALEWGMTEGVMVSNYGSGGDPSKRGERQLSEPAPTVTSKIDRNKIYVETGQQWYDLGGVLIKQRRPVDEPAPTVTGNAKAWKVLHEETQAIARHSVETGEPVMVTHMGDVAQAHGTVRPVSAPAPTLTASMDNGNFRWIDREALVKEVEPRVNNQSGTEFDLTWPADRPAPVIAGRDLVTMPGANANRFNGSTKSRNDGIRVTVEEAGVLQSFPANYPWKGTKTKKFQQVGNAVPPLLQCKLTQHLLGV